MMIEAKTLNLDTFNEMVFAAFENQTPETKLELLRVECLIAYQMKIQAMEALVQRLNDNLPYDDELFMVSTINKFCGKLGGSIDALIEKYPELKNVIEESEGNP